MHVQNKLHRALLKRQIINRAFYKEKNNGAFSAWVFTPHLSESDNGYYITLVDFSFIHFNLAYVKYTKGKGMPHSVKREVLASVSSDVKILF